MGDSLSQHFWSVFQDVTQSVNNFKYILDVCTVGPKPQLVATSWCSKAWRCKAPGLPVGRPGGSRFCEEWVRGHLTHRGFLLFLQLNTFTFVILIKLK